MSQPTDLFCHTIFFVKLNICISLPILREHIPPHDFPVDQGHNVPHKVWRDLFVKAFHGRWRTVYCGGDGGGGGCSTWGFNDQIMTKVREFYKYIFQQSLFIFPIMKRYTLEDKAPTKIMAVFILEVNS